MKLTSVMEGQMVGSELIERGRWVIQPEAILMEIHDGAIQTRAVGKPGLLGHATSW